jgi:hypothetical protein
MRQLPDPRFRSPLTWSAIADTPAAIGSQRLLTVFFGRAQHARLSWQKTVTDNTSGLHTGGSFGVSSCLSSSATNGPLTVKMDELIVTAP